MDYYSIDSILAEEEKLKVKFSVDVENFGFYLSPSHTLIKKEIKVDFPFFLIKFLLINEYCTIVEHPLKHIKFDLDACAGIVDLKNKYFYVINRMTYDKKYIFQIFFERISTFIPLLSKSDFGEEDVSKLSSEEKKIVILARKVFNDFENYYFNKNNNEFYDIS